VGILRKAESKSAIVQTRSYRGVNATNAARSLGERAAAFALRIAQDLLAK
jgi:hypothetical protein